MVKLDYEYIKEHKSTGGLLKDIIYGAVFGAVTTWVVLLAAWILWNTVIPGETLVKIAVIVAVGISCISFTVSIRKHHSVTLFDLHYTRKLQWADLVIISGIGTAIGVVCGLMVSGAVYLFLLYTDIFYGIIGCSTASSAFLIYIFRNKIEKPSDYVKYIMYGILTGIGMYLLGAGIVIAIGIMGFWQVAVIVVLETIFTAVYVYTGLLDWVEEEKARIQRREEYEQRRAAENAAT